MKTYSITTLGCRVNHYESEQLATLLRGRGLTEAPAGQADLRVIHTCSVTVQAASKSRQTVRRMVRLPVILHRDEAIAGTAIQTCGASGCGDSQTTALELPQEGLQGSGRRARVVVTGCWATSDPEQAKLIPGVDAVLGHHEDVSEQLVRLLSGWEIEDKQTGEDRLNPQGLAAQHNNASKLQQSGLETPEPAKDNGWSDEQQTRAPRNPIPAHTSKAQSLNGVNGKLEDDEKHPDRDLRAGKIPRSLTRLGTVNLPMLGERQSAHQRAFLKVQDGCDAHCTYCIIPQLRPGLWSKPIDQAVEEAQRLVEAGHREIVLTGIFLGAYGQGTALRRRQQGGGELGRLVEALCTRVAGLGRLRLSSLEPGDLDKSLIELLKAQPQVVPHFHLPLQSGSDAILRKMNRQYERGEFLEMADRLKAAFDRPALTTDIIVGFPGETDREFEETVEVAERVGFVHIHAFSYSPRPKTAAARWTKQWVRGPVVNQRIERLREIAAQASLAFRNWFIDQEVEVLVENASGEEMDQAPLAGYQHGRCERYFAVHFPGKEVKTGTMLRLRVERVEGALTFGSVMKVDGRG